ncbi:non-ribosomal peptide synthetase/type I polyketide synthase [Acidicapsa ligni]|uniref:non-ribosomal peptide synthetase/type I polyketide synthase n=1 Tax=Acidicapsa ligni TaxID=542300 RepID=UPI0021E0E074|nr:non-ribosomal peptide synthetase/type I polyketide synthase [Acidicapsa ligni]
MDRHGTNISNGTPPPTDSADVSSRPVAGMGDTNVESGIAKIWSDLLGLPQISIDDNFFEMGGTSLLATRLHKRINEQFQQTLSIAVVFEYPTIRLQAKIVRGESVHVAEAPAESKYPKENVAEATPSSSIAIIGMTGRFPGAESVEEFWKNLCDGVESITFFDKSELEPSERSIAEQNEGYVAARPLLKNPDLFDAEFFGVYPKEAAQMDPQHRILLECAWEVLERAGYDPSHVRESVGVFAGCSMNTYFLRNLADQRSFVEEFTGGYQVANYAAMMGNDKDFLPTRISYKLNLHGPSMSVQSACSTALVAVAQACQSLLTQGCDMALAGAVSITFPLHRGYIAQEGGLASLDGHCRPFDQHASGTVFGHGAGIVLLKRLDDALVDGDQVLAVIRGFALNNDGSTKAGYTAPSVEGQAQVIARAQKMAGVSADSISYIEAHGTGTPLGDPIEVAALTRAFRSTTAATQFCSLGTAKANVGHLDVASGATGLIKTVLQIENRTIPGLLHFTQPNPHLDLDNSPFFIDRDLRPWKTTGAPLRAGVSAFGVGGTNAHIIVEEPPVTRISDAGREHQLFVWSAKTPTALANISNALGQHFSKHTDANLADAAYTLQVGRSAHKLRRAAIVSSAAEAENLANIAAADLISNDKPLENPRLIFCFPGQGVQMVGMARRLYDTEPVFRQHLDACDAKLLPLLGTSLLSVIYPQENTAEASERLNQTLYAQPAIFAIEYALAQLWLSWSIAPAAMVGHSVGEYVAACLSGVVSLDDALTLIAARARLMQALPRGGMLAIRGSEDVVTELLAASHSDLDIAAVNSPKLCVVSGADAEIEAFIQRLDADKIAHRKLVTSHAFHSRMLDPMLEEFAAHVRKVTFHAPSIPYVSSLTGTWITSEEVAKPDYWTSHLRQTVRFADAIKTVADAPETVLLEAGPSETLVQIIRQITGVGPNAPLVIASQSAAKDGVTGDKAILTALGRLWASGIQPNWQKFHAGHTRKRMLLPTYPFDRKRFWIEPAQTTQAVTISAYSSLSLTPDPSSTAETPIFAAASPSLIEDSSMATSTPAVTEDAAMLNDLKALITDLSGTDLAEAESDASFLELGFDSLFLTQLTQGIQSKYRVKLTFRQIMESYPTLASLADHLKETVAPNLQPASAAPAPAPVAVTAPTYAVPTSAAPAFAPAPAAAPGSYEALFANQMQAMAGLFQQQLSLLGGQARPVVPQPAAAPIPVSAQPAPVAKPVAPAASASTEAKPAKPTFTPFKPLQRGESGGLNAVQESYLEEFIKTYNEKTGKSKTFTQEHRSVFADGRVVSGFNAQLKEIVYPIVVERAKGAYLWDKDGNKYIDILNGYGAILYGHSPDFIVDALRAQLELGFPIGPQTELAGECSELIREFTGMERVTFCNTGSEAVMGAMRLARTVTGRNLVVLFSGDYHGSFDEVLVKSVGNQRSMPVAPGIPRESVANILVLDYGTPEALEIIRSRADEIAAVLVEPVQSRHPELRPIEFLREVRSITEKSGSALIFDEVVTGFRTHIGGMQAVFGIKADLATYGKVVAGGMPMGILAGTPTFMDALDGGQWKFGDDSFPQVGVTFYAGTFMRHPLAMAAVRASLLHLKQAGPELQRSVAAKTAALVADLNAVLAEFNYPSQLETFSSWFYFPVPGDPKLARMLHFHLREQGIHIQEGFPCFLTTAHTDADLDQVRAAFRKGLEKMQAGQVLLSSDLNLAAPAAAKVALVVEAVPVARDFPITEQQREIFLGTQLGDEANCAFNESTSLVLNGTLNLDVLTSSLEKLVARHESLRSTIDVNGDVVHVSADVKINLAIDDLSTLPASEKDIHRDDVLYAEASTAFDLISGPLFRTRLIRLAPQEHVLVLTAHHIIFDGWSTNVLYSELSELYNAALKGQSASLPTPLNFSEYANAQHEQLNSPDRAVTEQFWLEQFKTLPTALQIPIDHPRPALRENAGATKRFVFPAEVLKAVKKAGARQGSTLFATLLAGFSLLIHRLSQQDDVVIGIPVAGQAQQENGGTLVGHGVNFLPIRSHLQPSQKFSEFLKQTRKTLLDAQDHQDYTYGTLLHKLKIPSDPSRLQLVEVQFNVEQVGAGLKFDGLTVDLSANPKTHVNMDMFFNFIDRGNELWLDCDYNTGLFDAETIDRWFGHLNAILQAFVADAEQPASQVLLLTAEQTQQILVTWNQTDTTYPRELPIQRVFEQQVELTPDAVAVIGATSSLTYFELNEKSNQVAHFLQKSGIKPGDRVAVCLHRSMEVIVSLLAILKAGAAYVPVDPSYPASRLSFLIQDSQAKVLITQRSIASDLPTLNTQVISLDQEWPIVALESNTNLVVPHQPEQLAYVMYTSGSTGNPKGVLIPHRAVLRLVKNNSFASFSADEVFLQLAPVSFDAATFEIWGALLNGGKLVLGPTDRVTPEEIGQLIAANGVTTVWLTAALFHLIVTEHLEILRPLRQLLAGGDVLSVAHTRKVCEELPHLKLVNGYGPTENTTFTCCHTITVDSLVGGTVPIGKPIANTRVYILDANRKPVPPGVTGELYAAGDGLALGYLNSPELTAEKFLDHTFETAPGTTRTERLYRTGDLSRYRADGTVEFLGRADTQVKIRGYRIELSEIENALERSPLVRAAVVAVRTDWVSANDAPGDKRLAAYVIPTQKSDAAALTSQLRKHLQDELPDYMQPAAVMLLESFPRTINGKVDRRALPAPVPEQLMRARSIVYPRTPMQETLAGIWSKVLGVKEVSIDDTIFELGGDSLLIFRIITLANQAGLKLTARHVFQHRTVAAICEQFEGDTNLQAAQTEVSAIQAIPRSLHRRPQTALK